jgi:hypothetical protein
MEFTTSDKAEAWLVKVDEPDPLRTYTYADYLNWEFEEQVELISGRIYKMNPAPTPVRTSRSVCVCQARCIPFKGQGCV